jgi:hypothetical protein
MDVIVIVIFAGNVLDVFDNFVKDISAEYPWS